jgi:hypothetical protein
MIRYPEISFTLALKLAGEQIGYGAHLKKVLNLHIIAILLLDC